MSGSQGQAYKEKIKPEVAVYLDEHYPGFFEELLRLAQSQPSTRQEGTTTIEAATDFTALQTIIEDENAGVRHIGDIFVDLNMNGEPNAFHNRATPGDVLTFQVEVSFDGTNYEYVDSGTVTASATDKVGIVIKDFWAVSKWRIRMRVDNDRGKYKFAWMYGGPS